MPPDVRTRTTMARCVYDGCCTPYGTAPVRHAPAKRLSVLSCRLSALPGCLSTDNRQPTTATSDASALRRPAAVVRNGRHVLDGLDVQTAGGQSADGRLATGARSLDLDVDRADPVLLRKLSGVLRRDLSGEGSAFARP